MLSSSHIPFLFPEGVFEELDCTSGPDSHRLGITISF